MCSLDMPTGTSTESSSRSATCRLRADARLSSRTLLRSTFFACLSSGVALPDDLSDRGAASTLTNGFPEMPSSSTGGRAGTELPRGKLDARVRGGGGAAPSTGGLEGLGPGLPTVCNAGLTGPGAVEDKAESQGCCFAAVPSASILNLANCAMTPSKTRSWSRAGWRRLVTAQNSRLSSADASMASSAQQSVMPSCSSGPSPMADMSVAKPPSTATAVAGTA